MQKEEINTYLEESRSHLVNELLPFWTTRMVDHEHGGYITHFDETGNDTGDDEKSLIAQSRSVYTLSSAHRAGYGEGKLAELASHGVDLRSVPAIGQPRPRSRRHAGSWPRA